MELRDAVETSNKLLPKKAFLILLLEEMQKSIYELLSSSSKLTVSSTLFATFVFYLFPPSQIHFVYFVFFKGSFFLHSLLSSFSSSSDSYFFFIDLLFQAFHSITPSSCFGWLEQHLEGMFDLFRLRRELESRELDRRSNHEPRWWEWIESC